MLLADCSPETALRIAEKIRDSVKAPGRRAADQALPTVTISIGAATTSGGPDTAGQACWRRADDCLYRPRKAAATGWCKPRCLKSGR